MSKRVIQKQLKFTLTEIEKLQHNTLSNVMFEFLQEVKKHKQSEYIFKLSVDLS